MDREEDHKIRGDAAEFDDGCGPVVCPNPKCNQVFFDLDEDFWRHGNADIECRRCRQPVECIGAMLDEQKPNKIIYLYRCDSCKITFTRKIPAMKKYCPSCRTTYRIFWHLLLKLPNYSSSPSPRKVLLGAA